MSTNDYKYSLIEADDLEDGAIGAPGAGEEEEDEKKEPVPEEGVL
jgi:hypothetical protein